jgi:hypothetical protein
MRNPRKTTADQPGCAHQNNLHIRIALQQIIEARGAAQLFAVAAHQPAGGVHDDTFAGIQKADDVIQCPLDAHAFIAAHTGGGIWHWDRAD